MEPKRTERGWAGHYISSDRCQFRRNTLVEYENQKIVISTVGLLLNFKNTQRVEFLRFGSYQYHFETMVFHAKPDDTRFHDADITRPIHPEQQWFIKKQNADDQANDMHEAIVQEIIDGLMAGKYLKEAKGG